MRRPGAGARRCALLAGALTLALLIPETDATEEAAPAAVLSWKTGAGQSRLIPALEVGGFIVGLNHSDRHFVDPHGHTRFGAVEWRPRRGSPSHRGRVKGDER